MRQSGIAMLSKKVSDLLFEIHKVRLERMGSDENWSAVRLVIPLDEHTADDIALTQISLEIPDNEGEKPLAAYDHGLYVTYFAP
jgi:hypothetical protein